MFPSAKNIKPFSQPVDQDNQIEEIMTRRDNKNLIAEESNMIGNLKEE